MSKKDMDSADHGQGIFDMVFINDVNAIKDIIAAKTAAYDKIDASKATDENKRKAKAMVAKAANVKALIFGMTNFSLSHQGMKVVK